MLRPQHILIPGFALLVAVASWHEAKAQRLRLYDAVPSVQVTTDKGSYEKFEPVITTIVVTNVSDNPQEYGPIRWTDEESSLDIRLVTPTGDTASVHEMYPAEEAFSLATYTYGAGETRSDTFNLLLAYPIWRKSGDYQLEVLFQGDRLDFESWTSIASTTISVSDPGEVDSVAVALLDSCASGTLDLLPWGLEPSPDYESLLDSLSTAAGASSDMKEFAQYVHALYADMDYVFDGRDSTDAYDRYQEFLSAYPTSVYKLAVEQGFAVLRFLGGASPYHHHQDSVTELWLQVLLEGAVEGLGMTTTLKDADYVPSMQPFSDEPWNLDDPSPLLVESDSITDWVLVLLVDTMASPDSIIAKVPTEVEKTGWTVVEFRNLNQGDYYVVVEHRNHLAIASDTLVDFTSGFAEHDFTTGHAYGVNPQAILATSPDTVYGMWSGDGEADGQVTAPDFNIWLMQTRAVMTGYIQSDYNMDAQSTTADHNIWILNTRKAVTVPGIVHEIIYDKPDNAPWTGSGSEAASKTSVGETIAARYRVTGDPYWASGGYVNVPIALKTNTGAVDTLGSATFDVYFNSDQIYYDHPQQYQDLADAGYTLEINEGVNEHGSFVRVDIYTPNPDTVSYQIDDQYPEKLLRLRFYENNGQITDHGVAMNRATLDVVLLSGGVFEEPDEIIPVFKDAYPY